MHHPSLGDNTHPEGVVLYIEDNPVNFMLVEHLLSQWPEVTLLHAETGKAGVAMARAAPIDLVLLDMHLPDMDGLEVLGELRDHPDTAAYRVVALSASAMQGEVDVAKRAGALHYWTKPLGFDGFLSKMRQLLT